jgi:PAS domain S-box-containing protein
MKRAVFASRLHNWLNTLPITDPVQRRMASLLQFILIGLMIVVIVATIVFVTLPGLSAQEKLNVWISDLFGFLVVVLPLALLRRGYFRASVLILISILFITPTLAVTVAFDLLKSGGILFQFTLAIILAGLLVSRRALIVTYGLSAAVVGFSAFQGQSAAPQLARANVEMAVNFILFNGLIALFIDQFGFTLRRALTDALERESELQSEINERKRVEDALRESEQYYRMLTESLTDFIVHMDREGRIKYINRLAEGYTMEMVRGASTYDFIPPDYHEVMRQALNRAFEEGEPSVYETKGQRTTTSIGWYLTRIVPVKEQGRVISALLISTDITEHKQAEEALRESENRYSLATRATKDVIWEWNMETDQLSWNENALLIFGYSPEEVDLTEAWWEDHIHADDRERVLSNLNAIVASGGTIWADEYRFQRRDGSFGYSKDRGYIERDAEGKPRRMIGAMSDVTERKQAEETLRRSEERFRALTENNWDGIVLFDANGSVTYSSPSTTRILGYDPDELVGQSAFEFIHQDDQAFVREQVIKSLEQPGEHIKIQSRILHNDGTWRWLEGIFTNLLHEPAVRAIVNNYHDFTERKQVEEKVQRQNRRLKVLREIDTAILSADSVENIVGGALSHIRELIDCRRASIALIDWGTSEALIFDVRMIGETSIPQGMRFPLALFQDMDMIQTLSKHESVLINDLSELANPPPQIQSSIKEGFRSVCILPLFSQSTLIGTFNLSSEIPGFFDEDRIGLGREVANQVAIAITQSRLVDALEERVREREHLITELTAKNAELERFTYTVSHDLKSPLVTMKGFLGYLEQDAVAGNVERLKGDTKRIANAVDKMGQLLDDLLELSRIGRFVNQPELVPFEELAHQALEFVHGRVQQHGITIELQSDMPAVYVDKRRLVEVLQNLLENATKYMSGQPNPHIDIGSVGQENGKHVFFIRDNGMGIAPEYHERIFGLFNKLDARTEGTGIGLALVRRIIEFHGGRIWVESEAGKGSTFYFTLPAKPED